MPRSPIVCGSEPRSGWEPPSHGSRNTAHRHPLHGPLCSSTAFAYWRTVGSRLRRMNTPSMRLVTTMIPLSKNG